MKRIVERQKLYGGASYAAILVGGNNRKVYLVGGNQVPGGDGGPGAWRRFSAGRNPCSQRYEERTYGPSMGIRVWLLLAYPERRLSRQRQRRGPVLRGDHQVSADIRRIRKILHPQRIGEPKRLSKFPHLERGRRVDDLRACVRGGAAIENPR